MTDPHPSPEELEAEALRERADTGMIRAALWRALSPEARDRLGSLTRTGATVRRARSIQTVEADEVDIDLSDIEIAVPRAVTPTIDEITLAALVAQTGTP